MPLAAPGRAISHQNVRLGPGRHPRPGTVVCALELASMLAGERFGDRPPSVCPVIGAIVRAYNDNVDDRRRQDLYRFAADVVGTRRDYRVQRRRAEAAIEWALARYGARGGTLLAPPDPEGPRDEIGYYVVGALNGHALRRGGWSDDEHGTMIALLDELIEIDAAPELRALIAEPLSPFVGELVEQAPQSFEDAHGDDELLIVELGEGGAEAWLETCPALLDQQATAVGECGEHDSPVAFGTMTLDQPRHREPFQHLGHARRAEVRRVREVAHRHFARVAKAEEQAILRVGELARSVGLAPAHTTHRGHRTLERPRDVVGGVALIALAYTLAKRI